MAFWRYTDQTNLSQVNQKITIVWVYIRGSSIWVKIKLFLCLSVGNSCGYIEGHWRKSGLLFFFFLNKLNLSYVTWCPLSTGFINSLQSAPPHVMKTSETQLGKTSVYATAWPIRAFRPDLMSLSMSLTDFEDDYAVQEGDILQPVSPNLVLYSWSRLEI